MAEVDREMLFSNYPDNPKDLAQELLDIQMGSVEDAINIADDIADAALRAETIDYIREIGQEL